MALATTLKKLSSKIINKFGNTLILTKITAGAYNPATGSTTDTTSTITTKGIDEDILRGEQMGDIIVTFVSDMEVDAFDTATYRGKTRDIVSIRQVAIENTTIIYEAILTGYARQKV